MAHPDASRTESDAVNEELCRAQVERIVASAEFDATEREGRFLRHVVDETLAGHAARIKAYSIAVTVFGRKETFDPQTDPIVRIEAGRLRRALERYYLTAGASDPLVISIPKGHYVPTFTLRDPIPLPDDAEPAPVTEPTLAPTRNRRRFFVPLLVAALVCLGAIALLQARQAQFPQVTASKPDLPHVQVERFEDLGRTEASADIARGLRQDVVTQLARFRDISVLVPEVASVGETTPPARYALHGSVAPTPVGFRLKLRLVQRSDGTVLWSETYDGDLAVAPLPDVQADIANKVAMQLGQAYGVIFIAEQEFKRTLSQDDWKAYDCVLSFYSFRATLNVAMIPDVQKCMEQTVSRFPDYSTAWALLSLVRFDGLRSVFPHDPVTSRATVERAMADARRAVALDPQNVRGLQAEMLAMFWNRQFTQGKALGDRGLALNPNDTDLLAEYGARLALSGEWRRGCALIRKAFEQDQVTMMYYNQALGLCSYFDGDLAEATEYVRKTEATSHPLSLLVAAAISAEAGNLDEANRFRRLLEESAPALVRNLKQEVTVRLARAEDVERFLQSLAKAGLN